MTPALPDYLDLDVLNRLIDAALAEDLGPGGVSGGDVTTLSTIPASTQATATFLLKEDGVVAGLWVAERIFAKVDPAVVVEFSAADGTALTKGTRFGTARGAARSLLVGERLALNTMQRMSGIATATRAMVEAVRGTHAQILDTRKTAPGLRALDKWAVLLGGGANHRVGLYDRILVKDNHVEASGGVRQALAAAKAWRATHNPALEIELEVRDLAEVREALAEGGADYLLLDNMARRTDHGLDVSLLAEAVQTVGDAAKTEASGNVTLETVRAIAETGVDFISSGALTHSVRALDISLKIGLDE